MEPIEFWKMNGSGNDFILIDNRNEPVKEGEMGQLVQQACRRRTSVGADGVIFVTESAQYDFGWRFFNADGGEVEMCGNGSRCVARFAYLKKIAGHEMTFETLAGPVSAQVNGRVVKVLMPRPGVASMDMDIEFQDGWKHCDSINTGVPHVVIGVEDLADHPVREQGGLIRYHARFSPEGTNANFMSKIGPNRLAVRTYERGVEDETLACGTGAIASALTAAIRGMVTSPVRVMTRGGEELVIHFQKEGDVFEEVWLEGPTSLVYEGRLHQEAL
ncbi:MAG: diaminopimelate epimerase [Deltaproteobacteria bacterium]|nr:diaminopimelate epimerase [Deltaproteobacteria bacterium]